MAGFGRTDEFGHGNPIGNTIGNSKNVKNKWHFIENKINVKMVRGTPRTLLDLPRHFLDHPRKV